MYNHIISYYRHLMRRGRTRSRGSPPSGAYRSWRAMKTRCNNSKNANHQRYGARGIAICPRWTLFSNFLADMGERPPGMSLERKDNELGYSPENCRWATKAEQNCNQRRTVRFTHEGRTMAMKEWARKLGIHYDTVKGRRRNGWSLEDALLTPPGMPRGSR